LIDQTSDLLANFIRFVLQIDFGGKTVQNLKTDLRTKAYMPFLKRIFTPNFRPYLVMFLVLSGFCNGGDLVKKSLRQVKEGDLQEAHKTLESARKTKKDDFGIDYVYSIYFLSPYQKTLKLDSS
jgi:hypothetical protein